VLRKVLPPRLNKPTCLHIAQLHMPTTESLRLQTLMASGSWRSSPHHVSSSEQEGRPPGEKGRSLSLGNEV